MSLPSIGFLVIGVVVGGSCFVSALRVWPVTLLKLASFVPRNPRPKRPLGVNDAIPLYLTGPALLGFVFLAVLTSTKFAVLAAAAITMNTFSRHLLNAPTRAGRKALVEL